MTENSISKARALVATIVVIIVVIAVWKFIDWRMQPPPPPLHPDVAPTPAR